MWFSVCTLIDNDMRHHEDSRGAAEWVHNKFWPLWWRISLSIRVQTTLNHIRFVVYHNINVKENALFRAWPRAWQIDASSVVWTLIDNGKLANQIARLVTIVVTHQCGAGSIPARCHMWVEFAVGYRLLRGSFSGFSCFRPSTATNISKFQFDQDRGPAWKLVKAYGASSLNIVIYLTHFVLFSFRRNSWETIFSKSTEVISMVIKLCVNCQRLYAFTLLTDSHTFLLKLVMRIRLYIKTISPCWWCSIFSSPVCLRLYWSCKEKLGVEYLSFIFWVTRPKKVVSVLGWISNVDSSPVPTSSWLLCLAICLMRDDWERISAKSGH